MKLSKTSAILLMGLLTAAGMAAPDLATVHGNGIMDGLIPTQISGRLPVVPRMYRYSA